MKKVLSLLLAFVMCLSMCACGGEVDQTETPNTPVETPEKPEKAPAMSFEDLIVSDKWVDAYASGNEVVYTFSEDGSATIRERTKGTWSIENDEVIFDYEDTDDTLVFSIVEKDSIMLLERGNKCYSRTSDLETVRPILRSEREKNAPTLDYNEYLKANSENALKAKEEYNGQVFKYTGIVVGIEDSSCKIGSSNSAGTVVEMTVSLSKSELMELSKGDIITFVGTFSTPTMPGFPPSMAAYIIDKAE